MATTRRATVIKALFLLVPVGLVLPLFLLIGRRAADEHPSFYQEPMKAADVWRLPLVEPHELITAYCCEGWNFQPVGFPDPFTADSVNCEKGYILFFGYPGTYGFLDTRQQRVVRLSTHGAFADSLAARSLSAQLYNTETVYRNWVRTGQLPWAAEILATQGAEHASR
ncbi:hypothetical protein Q5H92_08465 [Hymenobacter sp. M29]|uniref:Uncharacterized protein n=1 Tax=Hymenobacter mellowenesis TaxID=3063995 RepID=A0ABT9A965_9BACT|nr:hypothetical protein [Hymenobacter sp. M29]MDO7846386.1 hypothetical protein [Hymenobacter sp. M29]